ncbi:MAG: YeeE/YedE family protein [Elusimicrobia bacterium]|nr:MAG: YeeE/YedE family protein [Elusimicrobiota bacterium]
MKILLSFATGLLFGLGLIVSGMSQPEKVLAFLDLAGRWDPSLALVMAGAIAVATPAFQLAKHRSKSWLGSPMQLPTARQVDRRLIIGSTLFGVGWGLAGICPGPALVLLGIDAGQSAVFVFAMLAGMQVYARYDRYLSRRQSA